MTVETADSGCLANRECGHKLELRNTSVSSLSGFASISQVTMDGVFQFWTSALPPDQQCGYAYGNSYQFCFFGLFELGFYNPGIHITVLLLFWNMSGTTRVSRYQKGKTRGHIFKSS